MGQHVPLIALDLQTETILKLIIPNFIIQQKLFLYLENLFSSRLFVYQQNI
jgi:hypothetical protein